MWRGSPFAAPSLPPCPVIFSRARDAKLVGASAPGGGRLRGAGGLRDVHDGGDGRLRLVWRRLLHKLHRRHGRDVPVGLPLHNVPEYDREMLACDR